MNFARASRHTLPARLVVGAKQTGARATVPPLRAAALAILALALSSGPSLAGQKPTLTPADYGRWESFSGTPALAADGRWFAYPIRRVNEEYELRIRTLGEQPEQAIPWGEDPERVVPWGDDPEFSPDSRWLAWSVGVPVEERERLEEAGEPVRLGAALLSLDSGEERSFDSVRSRAFDATGSFLALQGYPPSESEGRGADLRVVVVDTAEVITFGNVDDYAWSDVGSLLALAIATGGDDANGVQVYDAASGQLRGLDSSGSAYRRLAWREDAADLAILRSIDSASEEGTAYQALAWRGLGGTDPERLELMPVEAGVADGLEVVDHAAPRWSEDGSMIAIGLRPAESGDDDDTAERTGERREPEEPADEAESGGTSEDVEEQEEPELPDLQIWHSSDVRLFPQQQASANFDARRTMLAVWHMNEGRVVQIGSDPMEGAELLGGWTHAIEEISEPYPWGAMFGRPYRDVWLVDVATGERDRVLEKVRFTWTSAGGRYLLSFDGEDYWSYDVSSGDRSNLTADLPADFADLEYDTPTDLLPPHGVGGWLDDDAAVFLYDKLDVWQVAPDGSGGQRLTAGSDEQVIHRVWDLDHEEEAIDPAAPLYLSLRGEWSEKQGYARILPGTDAVERLVFIDRRVSSLRQAEEADVFVYRAEARDDSPDYFAAGPDLASPRPITRTNPFQDDYAWTRAELFEFESESGRRLQAALLYPANHDPGRRYPMIVYTYEILTPQVHSYEPPSERDYYNFTAWTQEGYFVLLPDIVYTARDPGVSAVEAVRPAVAKTVQMGLVDADRVGLIGHSWGGYQATYLPTRTDIFAASVAGAPLTDFVSFMGAIHWNPGIPEVDHWETGQARMEVPFWEDPEAHRRNSPIHKVHEMETPLLMAFGDDDGVVDWDQGTEFYNFARRAGKQMVLLVYEGEDHGFRGEANQVDYHRRILEWFGHYLKGEPAPAWITDGIPVDELDDEKKRVANKGGGDR